MKEHKHQGAQNALKRSLLLVSMLLMLTLFLSACDVSVTTNGGQGFNSGQGNTGSTSGSSTSSGSDTGSTNWGRQSKTSNCQVNGPLQDKACTPGAIFSNATASQICVSGYSKSVRNVPVSVKDEAYREYGITHHTTGQYEVDHLISLELGGSNDIANLWPEAASPKPGFHEKDEVENYLHDQVCSGKIALHTAQTEIANNWLDVYNHMPASAKSPYSGTSY